MNLAMLRRVAFGLFVLAACTGTDSPPALATGLEPGTHTGTLQGAPYRIDIPAGWNGDLVMLMHGYQPAGAPQATPMKAADATSIFLARGYAVAQSAYASQGWAVGDAIVDNERLREEFTRAFARPAHTYVYGFSLGGLGAAASIERYPHAYSGALVMCGATISTPELMSRALVEPLLAFDTLIPGVLPDPAAPDSPPFVPPGVFANGTLMICLDVERFLPLPEFHRQVASLFGWVKSAPLAQGATEILIPGEPEARLEAERRRDGIPIEDQTWTQIETTAAELGV